MERLIIDQTLATPYGERAYKIIETLIDADYDAWWVGGGVRDMLLGKIPSDIDIGTSATPEQIEKLFKRVDLSPAELGSVRVLLGDDEFEITTFREDDEASDGRHPESIVFADRERDARRRDLTVNALYFDPISKRLYDAFNGEADLHEKLIRFIGDPSVRIRHDALRILRAVRFRALLDGQYHPETYAALREQVALTEALSGNRKLEELEKMLKTPKPSRAYEDLWELGILPFIVPELWKCKGVPQPIEYHHEGDVWDHLMRCIDSFKSEQGIDVRIAALFHDIGKAETFSLKERIRFDEHASASADITELVLNRLQCAKKRTEKISWLIRHHMMMATFGEIDDHRKSYWYYHPWFPELLQLFELDIAGTKPSSYGLLETIIADYEKYLDAHPQPQKPLIDGHEIMEILHLKPGEQVGKIMQQLQESQEKGEITSKVEARSFIQKFSQESQ